MTYLSRLPIVEVQNTDLFDSQLYLNGPPAVDTVPPFTLPKTYPELHLGFRERCSEGFRSDI